MVTSQVLLVLWIGVGFYVFAFILALIGKIFQKNKAEYLSVYFLIIGFILNGVAIVLKWWQLGRGPYDSFYDLLVSNAWAAVFFLLLLLWRLPKLKVLSLFVLPVVFLMLGWTSLYLPSSKPMPANFDTIWLAIHVVFAKLAFGSCAVSSALSGLYLWRFKRGEAVDGTGVLPKKLEELSYQLAAFGFINWGIMIAAGAIWANNAWGRYWGWDPIETWSLVSWLYYGAYLHLRRTFGWRGVKAAWVSVLGFAIISFSLIGVLFVFPGIHAYLKPGV
ncbi:MAG: cytochrome c biogenesis protein CcsA [Thermincolia bacterium]